jgi:hypothetical protein
MSTESIHHKKKGGETPGEGLRGERTEKGIVVGTVKANTHPTRQGILMVFIDPVGDKSAVEHTSQWRQVKYAPPFYSRTEASAGDNFIGVKTTAGMVYPAPDIGSKVLCAFPNSKTQDGFWFACLPDPYMMQALPESSMSSNIEEGKTGRGNETTKDLVRYKDEQGKLKGAALDFNDHLPGPNDVSTLSNYLKPKRALDILTQSKLKLQGIDQDEIRGLTTSTYMRETPSELFGINTKGRKLDQRGIDIAQRSDILELLKLGTTATAGEGGSVEAFALSKKDADVVEGKVARAPGHVFVMDDGDLEGNNNLIRLRTAGGHQILMHDKENVIYISNKTGTTWIQMDANGQLDIYSKTNINLRSKNINMHADSSIKMHAGKTIQLVAGANIHLEGGNMANLYSKNGPAFVYGGAGVHVKSGKTVNIQASSTMNLKAGANMNLKASCIALQGPAASAEKQNAAGVKTPKDTRPNGKGFWEASTTVRTTVDRAPSHEPFSEHKVTTQESIYSAVQVQDVASGGELEITKPKNPFKTPSLGLTEILQEPNPWKLNAGDIFNAVLPPTTRIGELGKGIIIKDAVGEIFDSVVPSGAKLFRNMSTATMTASPPRPYNYVDSVTNAIGKFGFTVESLQRNGYVRPEAFFNGQLIDSRLWTGKDGIDSLEALHASGSTQENMFIADLFNAYQSAVLNGAIQDSDGEKIISGMVLVSLASDAEYARKFREGETLEPRPIPGTTTIDSTDDILNKLKIFFQKGVAAAVQAQSSDGTGYTSSFYQNISATAVEV